MLRQAAERMWHTWSIHVERHVNPSTEELLRAFFRSRMPLLTMRPTRDCLGRLGCNTGQIVTRLALGALWAVPTNRAETVAKPPRSRLQMSVAVPTAIGSRRRNQSTPIAVRRVYFATVVLRGKGERLSDGGESEGPPCLALTRVPYVPALCVLGCFVRSRRIQNQQLAALADPLEVPYVRLAFDSRPVAGQRSGSIPQREPFTTSSQSRDPLVVTRGSDQRFRGAGSFVGGPDRVFVTRMHSSALSCSATDPSSA
jgi:hypothetical protein